MEYLTNITISCIKTRAVLSAIRGERLKMVKFEINLQTEVYLSDEVVKNLMTVFKDEVLTVNTTIETLATIALNQHIMNNYNKFFK